MKRRLAVLVIGVAGLVAVGLFSMSEQPRQPKAATAGGEKYLFACQGRVEGASDPVEVSASMDGVIQTVLVSEGQSVQRGQLVARVGCADLEANVESQRASVESARQALVRLHRGSRDEDRRAAAEATTGARAVRDHAKAQFERFARLFKSEDVSRQSFESAQRDLEVAESGLRRTEEQERLVLAPPLTEDVGRLDADLAGAEARLRSAEAPVRKCSVESPVTGTVIKVVRRAGESVSTFTRQPIVTIGDFSIRRVRAEVDERDVAKVFVGQRAEIRLDGDDHGVAGSVSRTALRMGRKSVQAILPGDKDDRDVLDVWIDLPLANRPQLLPMGLRVLVRFSKEH
jgi:HlyD family secretion protein